MSSPIYEAYAIISASTNNDDGDDLRYHKPNIDCNKSQNTILKCVIENDVRYIYEINKNGFIISISSKKIYKNGSK